MFVGVALASRSMCTTSLLVGSVCCLVVYARVDFAFALGFACLCLCLCTIIIWLTVSSMCVCCDCVLLSLMNTSVAHQLLMRFRSLPAQYVLELLAALATGPERLSGLPDLTHEVGVVKALLAREAQLLEVLQGGVSASAWRALLDGVASSEADAIDTEALVNKVGTACAQEEATPTPEGLAKPAEATVTGTEAYKTADTPVAPEASEAAEGEAPPEGLSPLSTIRASINVSDTPPTVLKLFQLKVEAFLYESTQQLGTLQ